MEKPGHGWWHAGLVAAVVLSAAACTGGGEPPVVETPAVTPTDAPVAAGTVWSWGANKYGQLGDGSFSHQQCEGDWDCSFTPLQVAELTGVTAISGGNNTGYALKSDGTVWSWGDNYTGQLGSGIASHAPQAVSRPYPVCGQADEWELICSPSPLQVAGLTGVIAISGGGSAGYALKADGTVWAWGSNKYGQLGDDWNGDLAQDCWDSSHGVWVCNPAPVQVLGLSDVTAISGGGSAAYALKADGTVWTWGSNYTGQLGTGISNQGHCGYWAEEWEESDCSRVPVPVAGLTDATAISTGSSSNTGYALKADGTVWAWGDSSYGALGDGQERHDSCRQSDMSPDYSTPALDCGLTPVQVANLSGLIAISGGGSTGYASKSDGSVWAWGSNSSGQLGDGSLKHSCSDFDDPAFDDCSRVPVQVTIDGVSAIFGGSAYAYALKSNGTLWAWGSNPFGILGDQAIDSSPTPRQVTGPENVTAVATSVESVYFLIGDRR